MAIKKRHVLTILDGNVMLATEVTMPASNNIKDVTCPDCKLHNAHVVYDIFKPGLFGEDTTILYYQCDNDECQSVFYTSYLTFNESAEDYNG